MKCPALSVILSVHNRKDLLLRGLWSWSRQTVADEIEVVIVDDGSTDGLYDALKEWRGRVRMQYVRYDRTRHPVYEEMNRERSKVEPQIHPLWYHTPALAHNIGFRVARAPVLYVTQPEIIQASDNARLALDAMRREAVQAYGDVWMADQFATERLRQEWATWSGRTVAEMLDIVGARSSHYRAINFCWYVGVYHREAVEAVGGVDEEYMRGCYAEDENFRERVRMAGYEPVAVPEMFGLHQWHDDKEPHRDRKGMVWEQGAIANRRRWEAWKKSPEMRANPRLTWGALHHVTYHEVME